MTTLPLLNWMLASTVLLGLLWLPYRLALRSERFFAFNRAYLLPAPLLAASLPLLPASFWPREALAPALAMAPVSGWLPTVQLLAPADHESDITFWLTISIYIGGVAWGIMRLVQRLWQLAQLTRCLPHTAYAGYTLVHTAGQYPVSSFGRWVYWQEAAGAPTPDNALLRHELAHISHRHTLDRLLLAVLKAGLWFNPFVYLLNQALEMTHEFQADADAAGPLPNRPATGPTYAQLLARYAAAQFGALPTCAAPPLTHSFTYSPILTRLAMLKNSLPMRRWKQALVLPALTAVLLATACERQLVAPATAPTATATAETMRLLPPPPPTAPNANAVETAEQQPDYPGGLNQFITDLNAAIKYPAEAKAEKLQGRLFIGFTVGADGRIYDAALKKELIPSYKLTLPDGSKTNVELKNNSSTPAQAAAARALEAEALRALQSLTKQWQPGRTAGKPVAVSLILPVQFAL
jgi:hypothetical protein